MELLIAFSISLIIAGALGNLTDRIFLGEVVDFFDFMIGNFRWYIFNIADASITVGLFLFLYNFFVNKENNSIEKNI